jgi:signal transduction histidine kinase
MNSSPINTLPAAPPASDPANPAPDQARQTLLIVDDEEGPRQSLRVVFKEDYNLLIAADGLRAIELAKQHKINAAVVDIRMTGMNGTEVLEKLKAIQPSVEVIMLTAYETVDTIRRALRLGACDYLNKPFDIGTIRKAVATAMERHSLTDEIRSNNEKLQALQSELHNQKLQEEIARTRGEIYASIIHDINGPLTIISGFIQIINQRVGDSKRLEGEDLDMVKDRLRRITRQVSNCIDISHRYLNFMRQQGTSASWVSVNQILEDLRELLNVHPSKGTNRLKIQPVPENVELQINGTDLIQILLNLAINALQCTPTPHGVDITGHVLHAPVDTAQRRETAHDRVLNLDGFKNAAPILHLTVQDDGPGIPPEIMAKLFQPYFSTKAPGKGTGLGLSIVQRLLKEARGCLHVTSQPGAGTCFNIYLPAFIKR